MLLLLGKAQGKEPLKLFISPQSSEEANRQGTVLSAQNGT